MPSRTPRPDAATATKVPCPACGVAFAWPPTGRCERCGVDLTAPVAAEVFDLDRRWAALAAERLALVRRLEETRPGEPAAATATPGPPPPTGHVATSGRGIPALLGLAGAALLTAAAVVFTAVAWTSLPALAKAAILLAATAAAAAGALRLHSRGTTTAGSALGVLTMTLVLVDVTGLERAGILELGEFAIPLGLLVAAVAGWLLARAGLGWVSGLGAVTAAAGAFTLTVTIADVAGLSAPAVTLVGTVAAVLLGASAPAWATRSARTVAGLLAGLGLTLAGLVSAVAIADDATAAPAALAATAVPIVLSLAATRRNVWAIAPATLLTTVAAGSSATAAGATGFGVAAVVAAVVAAIAWSLTVADRRWHRPTLAGAVPASVTLAAATLLAGATTAARLEELLTGTERAPLDPWAALAVPLVAVAAAAWPAVRRRWPLVAGLVLLIVAGTLPPPAAWVGLAVVAALAATADRFVERSPVDVGVAALTVAAVAVGWAATEAWSVAVSAAVAAAVAALLVRNERGVRAMLATAVGSATAALSVGAAMQATGVAPAIGLGGALLVTLVVATYLQGWSRDELGAPALATAAAATVLVPVLADSLAAAGTLLLVGAVGWLAVAVSGWRPARWITSGVSSVGTAVLLGDAGVEVVEAYTVVPAVTLGLVGVLWLRREPHVRTVTALWPALAVAITPSLLVLADEPRALLRTLLLTGLAGILATIGVRLRWLAPTVAGAVTASGVALTQLAVVVGVVPRWVAFGIVGGALVWLAATYERQQLRARALGDRLAGFR